MNQFQSVPNTSEPQVVVVGTFDGLHRGHQHLIERAREYANQRGEILSLITFEPDPETVLAEVDPTDRRLLSHADKIKILNSLGVDHLYEIGFDESFASIRAGDFIQSFLMDRLEITRLCVGTNFRFGRRRRGDTELLKEKVAPEGIELDIVDPLEHAGETISSTRIRQRLREGRCLSARVLLGRPYILLERVVRGDGRGREIGFPTLNFKVDRTIHPRHGVYSAWVQGQDLYPSVANFGYRPTVDKESSQPVLEVHSLEEDPGLDYGDETHVYLAEFLRDEREFQSIDGLKDQINRDLDQARQSLAEITTPDPIPLEPSITP